MLRSFKPKDGQDSADGRGSTLKHLANGTKEDKENFDKIKELQGQVCPHARHRMVDDIYVCVCVYIYIYVCIYIYISYIILYIYIYM